MRNKKISLYRLMRQIQGLTPKQIYKRTGIPEWVLKDFEAGLTDLNSEDFLKLCHVLRLKELV
jgi:hypothetical protein